MINYNNMLVGLLLANRSEKMLSQKQAVLPKNWKTKQSLLMSVFPNPTMGMIAHQNEVIKEDQKVSGVQNSKLDKATKIIEAINTIPGLQLPDKIVEQIKNSGLNLPSVEVAPAKEEEQAWKPQVAYHAQQLAEHLAHVEHANGQDEREDDLTRLVGVGETIEKVLKTNKVKSYKDIETFGQGYVNYVLEKTGTRASEIVNTTLVKQAKIARLGQWDKLEKFKD